MGVSWETLSDLYARNARKNERTQCLYATIVTPNLTEIVVL